MKHIDTSDKTNTEPKDEHLTKLLSKAYKGKIKCRKAVVDLNLIQPFSDFKPEITKDFRADFLRKYLNLKPPELYVYQKDNKLVMSQDYLAYYMYMEVQAETAICIIIGDFDDLKGITTGPEFDLKPTKN